MAKKKIIKSNVILSGIIILISIIDLLILYYFKYNSQGLPFSNFKMAYIGNVLNLSFTLLVIIGLILYTFFTKHGYRKVFLISFTVILNLILLAAIISTKIKLPIPNEYVLDHPLSKVLTGALFSVYQFFQFVFLSLLWYSAIGKELVILRAVINSVVIVTLLLAVTFIYVNFNKVGRQLKAVSNKKVSVAVVLGAAVWSHNSPSPSLAARVDKAAELYKTGKVNKIQLTGSNAPGEMSESEVAYNYIQSEHIPDSDIWLEHRTVSTSEQVRFILDNISNKKNVSRIVVVSDSYHLTRVAEMCKFYGVKALYASSNLKFSFEHNLYYKTKESLALLIFWLFGL